MMSMGGVEANVFLLLDANTFKKKGQDVNLVEDIY